MAQVPWTEKPALIIALAASKAMSMAVGFPFAVSISFVLKAWPWPTNRRTSPAVIGEAARSAALAQSYYFWSY